MRLLFVTRAIPNHIRSGGMERAAWNLIEDLSEENDVTVLTTHVPGEGVHFQYGRIKVKTVPFTKPGRYSVVWWLLTAMAELGSYDCIVSISAGSTSQLWFRRKHRFIFQAHGTALAELRGVVNMRPRLWSIKATRLLWWSLVDRVSYRRASAVVVIGPAVEAGIRRVLGSHNETSARVVCIPNGVTVHGTRLSSAAEAPGRLLYIGRLTHQKGVDRIVSALAFTEAFLTVIGDGPYHRELDQMTSVLRLRDRVRFTGQLPPAEIAQHIESATALLFFPRNIEREGLPMVVLEALAAGLPVITIDGQLWPTDLRPHLNLIADTPDAIAAAIRDPGYLERPSLPLIYTRENVLSEWETLLRSLK